jgi:hypothetical protein
VAGKPASVVAFVNVAGVTLSGSKRTVAVFFSKSTWAPATPGTFSSAYLTVILQVAQIMFWTFSVTVCGDAAYATVDIRSEKSAMNRLCIITS